MACLSFHDFGYQRGRGRSYSRGLVGQPIIPSGHHQDLADDLRLLEKTTENINRIGRK